MSSDNEVLWVVTKHRLIRDYLGFTVCDEPSRYWLFRTRRAARTFANKKDKKSKVFEYEIHRASWGNI